MEFKLSKVGDLGGDSDFAEEEGSGEVDEPLVVEDDGMGSGGGDLSGVAFESSGGRGEVGNGAGDGQLSVFVFAPGVDEGDVFVVGGGGGEGFLEEVFVIFHHNSNFKYKYNAKLFDII